MTQQRAPSSALASYRQEGAQESGFFRNRLAILCTCSAALHAIAIVALFRSWDGKNASLTRAPANLSQETPPSVAEASPVLTLELDYEAATTLP